MEAHLQKWLRTLPRRYKKCRRPERLWSMTTHLELCFCESYARSCFSGKGRIVDLGCWYGATTLYLARGLTKNRKAKFNQSIHAFDLFIWVEAMDQVADQNKMQKVYRPGESFFHDVQKLLEPYKDIVRVHQQDLMTYQPPPEPVELLFIDAMKTWPLAQKITTEFFPLLIPGLSVVVQQDFAFHHPIAATNHLIMWRLRDYFEWVHHVPRSASVAFVSKKRIEPDAFPDLSVDSFTLDEINQAYDYSLACVPQDPIREFIEAAKLLFLIERGYYEAALTHGRRLVENKTKFKERVIADSQRIIEEHQKAGVARGVSLPYEGRSVDQSEALAEIASLLPALTT